MVIRTRAAYRTHANLVKNVCPWSDCVPNAGVPFIILGALIMIGVGALIVGAMLGAGRRAEVANAAPFLTAVPAPGARIESTEIQGNRILMRLSGGESDELVVLDAASGRLLGHMRLEGAR